jgi:hypothetical protein
MWVSLGLSRDEDLIFLFHKCLGNIGMENHIFNPLQKVVKLAGKKKISCSICLKSMVMAELKLSLVGQGWSEERLLTIWIPSKELGFPSDCSYVSVFAVLIRSASAPPYASILNIFLKIPRELKFLQSLLPSNQYAPAY